MSDTPDSPQPLGPTLRRAFRLCGRVQGVGYRWWAVGVARQLDVHGTVRNLPDGTVEVQAEGSPACLEEFRRRLRRGPPGARVEAIHEIAPAGEVPRDFRILS
ncbi:MAG: acylphosphatase [Gemmatimonadota bacterium]